MHFYLLCFYIGFLNSKIISSQELSILTSGSGVPTSGEPAPLPDFSNCVDAPALCPNKNITFWHYTRSTAKQPFELNMDNFGSAPYQNGAPFVVLIHGYTGWKDYAPNPELREAFFGVGDYNIISVDWSPLAKEPCYVSAAYNVKVVANCTARQLLNMMNKEPQLINRDNLHVIGFSLGAQIAGNIGTFFKSIANITVKRMTGLDPALPLFDSVLVPADSRMSPDDADFLDVYHTAAGSRGVVRPVGKVDFYFNKAYNQPGCGNNGSCDHYRAVQFYGESMSKSTKGFWGAPCNLANIINYFFSSDVCKSADGENTTMLSGYYIDQTARGTYQIHTNSSPPFALGKNPPVSNKKKRFPNIFGNIKSIIG